jgi:hypothetical protein
MMMRAKMLLTLAAFAVMAMGGFVAGADNGCDGTGHRHTASGSCKDTDNNQIHCGSTGNVPVQPGGVRVSANQTANGGEVEACSDQGSGNQHGRLMVQVDRNEGARAILDSDPDQPFPAGYIIVQANESDPGVWCSTDSGTGSTGDGYARSWDNPGPDGGLGPDSAECIPNPPAK